MSDPHQSKLPVGASMLKMRPYQVECLAAIKNLKEQGYRRQLVSLATGGGKTIVFAGLIERTEGRCLVLAHTNELLDQARDKIRMMNPSIDIGIVNGDSKQYGAKVVVASVQSAMRPATLEQLSGRFQLCVVDECHHAATDSQRKLLEDLGFGKDTNSLLIGCTATPFRSDGKGLGEVFDIVAYEKNTRELIEEGYLCRPEGKKVATDIDFSKVTLADGDFAPTSLARVMDTPEMNALIVDAYRKSEVQSKTICFAVTVQHAYNIAEAFKQAGISVAVVSGAMERAERSKIIEGYRSGGIQVLCNCQVLTEGFDAPETACVIVARPTKSRLLYQQMVGRGLRLWPNKKSCVVLDFCDKAHSLCNTVNVLLMDAEDDETAKRQAGGKSTNVTPKLPPNLNSKLKSAIVAFDPLSDAFSWQRECSAYVLRAGASNRLVVYPSSNGQHGAVFLRDGHSHRVADGIPFEYAFAAAEDFARANRQFFIISDREAAWRDQPASDKQKDYIRRCGYKAGLDGLTRGQASDLIASGALKKVS